MHRIGIRVTDFFLLSDLRERLLVQLVCRLDQQMYWMIIQQRKGGWIEVFIIPKHLEANLSCNITTHLPRVIDVDESKVFWHRCPKVSCTGSGRRRLALLPK